ncbi:hypothetical protein PIROE2DRAFT_17561, partial [Piromyces sp. E2]
NKKGNKPNTINHWDNTNVPKKDDNNKIMKKKDKSDLLSFPNNEYDTSIVINNLSKDVSEKMIQIFYKDFKIKNLKINRNSENIIAYIDFENAEMCTEAKKMNTLPLKDNRKKFVIGRSKPSSDDDLKKRENLLLNMNNKNHNSNFKTVVNVNHNNDLLMKQQVLRKTKSNNSIYTGWKTTTLSDQDKNLDFNEKVLWQRQSTSNIMLDQNNSLNTINLNTSSNNSGSTSGTSSNNNGNANNPNNKYMRWSINEPISTDMWMNNGNNGNKLKDNPSFNNVNMNDHGGLTNKASFNNIPINNFEGYPYMPSNNNNMPPPPPPKQQHPFYMNHLNNKINNSNWDTPDGAMDQNINQNTGMMSSMGPGGMKNLSNKLMINQGQGPSLYMNQMQQPNPMMTMNQNNGMMLTPQNPFPNSAPPNRNKPMNGNQVMMNNNFTAPPQPPPQNMNMNNGPLNNNSSLLNTANGTTDMSNGGLMNDNTSPNEWTNSNGNMNNNFMPLYYPDGNMNGHSNRPMKLMYNSVNQYSNPNKTGMNNANNTPTNSNTTNTNTTNNIGGTGNTNQTK